MSGGRDYTTFEESPLGQRLKITIDHLGSVIEQAKANGSLLIESLESSKKVLEGCRKILGYYSKGSYPGATSVPGLGKTIIGIRGLSTAIDGEIYDRAALVPHGFTKTFSNSSDFKNTLYISTYMVGDEGKKQKKMISLSKYADGKITLVKELACDDVMKSLEQAEKANQVERTKQAKRAKRAKQKTPIEQDEKNPLSFIEEQLNKDAIAEVHVLTEREAIEFMPHVKSIHQSRTPIEVPILLNMAISSGEKLASFPSGLFFQQFFSFLNLESLPIKLYVPMIGELLELAYSGDNKNKERFKYQLSLGEHLQPKKLKNFISANNGGDQEAVTRGWLTEEVKAAFSSLSEDTVSKVVNNIIPTFQIEEKTVRVTIDFETIYDMVREYSTRWVAAKGIVEGIAGLIEWLPQNVEVKQQNDINALLDSFITEFPTVPPKINSEDEAGASSAAAAAPVPEYFFQAAKQIIQSRQRMTPELVASISAQIEAERAAVERETQERIARETAEKAIIEQQRIKAAEIAQGQVEAARAEAQRQAEAQRRIEERARREAEERAAAERATGAAKQAAVEEVKGWTSALGAMQSTSPAATLNSSRRTLETALGESRQAFTEQQTALSSQVTSARTYIDHLERERAERADQIDRSGRIAAFFLQFEKMVASHALLIANLPLDVPSEKRMDSFYEGIGADWIQAVCPSSTDRRGTEKCFAAHKELRVAMLIDGDTTLSQLYDAYCLEIASQTKPIAVQTKPIAVQTKPIEVPEVRVKSEEKKSRVWNTVRAAVKSPKRDNKRDSKLNDGTEENAGPSTAHSDSGSQTVTLFGTASEAVAQKWMEEASKLRAKQSITQGTIASFNSLISCVTDETLSDQVRDVVGVAVQTATIAVGFLQDNLAAEQEEKRKAEAAKQAAETAKQVTDRTLADTQARLLQQSQLNEQRAAELESIRENSPAEIFRSYLQQLRKTDDESIKVEESQALAKQLTTMRDHLIAEVNSNKKHAKENLALFYTHANDLLEQTFASKNAEDNQRLKAEKALLSTVKKFNAFSDTLPGCPSRLITGICYSALVVGLSLITFGIVLCAMPALLAVTATTLSMTPTATVVAFGATSGVLPSAGVSGGMFFNKPEHISKLGHDVAKSAKRLAFIKAKL
jgi:hypothetical protein